MKKYLSIISLGLFAYFTIGCCNHERVGVQWDVAYSARDEYGRIIVDKQGRPLYYFEKLIPVQLEDGSIIHVDAYTGERRSPVRFRERD